MLRWVPRMAFLVAVVVILSGCGPQGVKKETIEIKPVDPMQEVKQILQNYANGQPVTSEASDFPRLIENAKKADPVKGELIEKTLNEIQRAPADAKSKAQALLGKL